jgi:hypothetical protein
LEHVDRGNNVLICDKGKNRLYNAEGLLQVALLIVNSSNSSSSSSSSLVGLVGQLQRNARKGAAEFRGLKITSVGMFRLQFVKLSGRVSPVLSDVFSIVIGDPFSLHILVQPSPGEPGYALRIQPQIAAEDKAGNQIPSFGGAEMTPRKAEATNASNDTTSTYNATQQGNAGKRWFITAQLLRGGLADPAPLSPALPKICVPRTDGIVCTAAHGGGERETVLSSVAVVAGKAEFTDLQVNVSGTDFALRFASLNHSLVPAISERFNVADGVPARIAVLQQPAGAIAGAALKTQPSVLVLDLGGNRLTSISSKAKALPSSIVALASGFVTVELEVLEALMPANENSASREASSANASTHTFTPPVLLALAGNNGSAPVVRGLAHFQSLGISAPGRVRLIFRYFANASLDNSSPPSPEALTSFAETTEPRNTTSPHTASPVVLQTASRSFTASLLPVHLNLSVVPIGQALEQASLAHSLPALEVLILDKYGIHVEAEDTFVVQVRVSLPSVSGAPALARLDGTKLLRCRNGRVLFTDLRIDTPYGAHSLTFVTSGLAGIRSPPFAVYGAKPETLNPRT